MRKEHTILNEKYRPTNLENFICEENHKAKFNEYVENQDIPHILLAGPAGSGKTTLAKILTENIDCEFMILNAMDERSIESIRTKVGGFASTRSFKPLKIVVLDESTHLLEAAQVILLNMMETFSLNTRFILTGNYPERLIAPLKSRCQEFNLKPPSKKAVAKHVAHILNEEEVEYESTDVATLTNLYYPDIRKVVNTAQSCIYKGKLKVVKTSLKDVKYMYDILEELKKPSSKSFTSIRQIVADNSVNDFDNIFKFLYNNIDELPNPLETMILVGEYQYRSVTVPDKEISFMTFISATINK